MGGINFDSIVIGDFDENLKSVATSLLYTDISSKRVIIQSGYIYHYAFAMLIGLVVLITWLLMDYGI